MHIHVSISEQRLRLYEGSAVVAEYVISTAANGPALPANPLDGRVVYERKQCHDCHGVAGDEARGIRSSA